MRRWLFITGIVALLCLGVAVTVKYCHSIFHGDDVSEVYLKYEKQPGIEATYIKGFLVTDSIRVDITLLRALDTANWIGLYGDFCLGLKNLSEIPEQYRDLYLFGDGIGFNVYRTNHPELVADKDEKDVEVAVIYKKFRTVMVCHTETREQTEAIMNYQMYDYFKNIK